MRRLIGQLLRYGTVGALGVLIDVGLFTLLRASVFAPEHLEAGPIVAKVCSGVVAIVFAWLGNRYWTFGPHRRPHAVREALEFFSVATLGLLVGLACLGVSHYVLGFTSQVADSIAANVVGLALGSIVRFTLYKLWVFAPHRAAGVTRTG
ncbi:GtrA family protein [Frigoribacterium sp. 2-23]|uniref:GtrA family protein n=1 Tax=Frigoribacterium sp. 2-23 TaxID=3415006 RepID=UPI003C6FC611